MRMCQIKEQCYHTQLLLNKVILFNVPYKEQQMDSQKCEMERLKHIMVTYKLFSKHPIIYILLTNPKICSYHLFVAIMCLAMYILCCTYVRSYFIHGMLGGGFNLTV